MIQAIFLIGGWVLTAALLPTIAAGGGPVLSSCLITLGVLAAYTGAFMKMRQWASALGVGCSAAAWLVPAIQAAA